MINPEIIGLTGILVLVVSLALGVHVGIAMGFIGFLGAVALIGFSKSLSLLATTPFHTVDYTILVLPMFILMGEFAFHGGMGVRLYAAASKWLGRIYGGVAMTTTVAVAFFSAISGSALASAATFAKMAVPEMTRLKYDSKFACAVVAASATLDILIPPSGLMVLYCIFTGASLGKVMFAGFIPGFLSALNYMIIIYVRARIDPNLRVRPIGGVSWSEKMFAARMIAPEAIIVFVVFGGIYSGIFSPIEASAVGAFCVLVAGLARKALSLSLFKTSLITTARTTAMIFLIIAGSMIFSKFLAIAGLQEALLTFVSSLAMERYIVLVLVLFSYLILGMFMDVVAMLAITLPIFFPLLVALRFDDIWIAILIMKMAGIGTLTPPVGMVCYLVKAIVGDVVTLEGLFRGIWPFVAADVFTVGLLVAFPQISLWLPSMIYK